MSVLDLSIFGDSATSNISIWYNYCIKYNYTKENPKEQNVLTYSLVPFLDIEFPYLMKIFNF